MLLLFIVSYIHPGAARARRTYVFVGHSYALAMSPHNTHINVISIGTACDHFGISCSQYV
jgi:hypothetical protein